MLQLCTYEPDVINWSKVKKESKSIYSENLQCDHALNEALSQEICNASDSDIYITIL